MGMVSNEVCESVIFSDATQVARPSWGSSSLLGFFSPHVSFT